MSLTDPASQLPRSDEIWQIARFRLPLWIDPDEGGPPFRPWCVIGLRPPDQFFVQDPGELDEPPPAEQVAEALVEAARQAGLLPRRLLVAEDDLAGDLRRCLTELGIGGIGGIEIELAESLPQLMEALDPRVQPFFRDDPGLLAGEGVTLDQVASFADAAASFARAEPWRHLVELDKVRVESRETGTVSFAIVLGSVDEEHGVVFLPDEQEDGSEEPWLMVYVPAWEIPVEDLYTWERHGLALARENRYPVVSSPDAPDLWPDAGILAWIEAVLRAIAVSTEDEMDSGRWEKTVETGRGPMRLVLSLPDLIRQAAESPGPETSETPETPEDTARDLAEQAFEAVGRRRVALARQALAIWPGCVDALILLAGYEPDPESSVAMYSRAMEVAERAFDPLLFETRAGDFWEIPEARPYLQARFGLAEALWDTDRWEEAVAHLEELLRLDDLDHLGARRHLVDKLLLLDRDREAARLLDACPDESLAHSLYTRTLLAFRREGDSPGARNCLTLALAHNRFVPEYLLTDEFPPLPATPLFRPGDRSEAFLYGVSSCEVWDCTPGALDWLRDRLAERRKAGRKRGKPGKKKKKGRR